jgi:hypothetical protein
MQAASTGIAFSWLMALMLGGGVGLPLGVPPLPEDPLLARVAPEECLAYFASAGMANPQANSPNQTERLFAEPEVRNLAAQVERLIRARVAHTKGLDATGQVLAEEGPTLVKALLTRPLALYLGSVKAVPGSPPQVRAGAVLSLGEHSDQLKAALERCEAALLRGRAREVTIDGTTFRQLSPRPRAPTLTWGVKGKYLYVAVGEGELEELLKRGGGSAPKWLTELHRQLPVGRVSTVGMINAQDVLGLVAGLLAPKGDPGVTRVLEATGLDGIDQLAGVSGLDREGYVSRSLIRFKGDPKGLLKLADQKPLTAADLAVLPRDATFAVARSVDMEKVYVTVLGVVEKINPQAAETFRKNLEGAEEHVGLKLKEDVLRPLGTTWYLFDSPGGGGMFTGLTLVASLKDAQAAEATQAKLLRLVEAAREQQSDPQRGPRIAKVAFAGHTIHVLEVRERGFPLAPAWCVTEKHLVVALFPEAIKAFLSRGKGFQPLTSVPEVSAALAGDGKTLAIIYTDTRRLFDLAYPVLTVFSEMAAGELRREGIEVPPGLLPSARSIRPHLRPTVTTARRTRAGIEIVSRQTLPGGLSLSTAPIAVGLLLPAVQKVREAAGRTQSMNNLKQIGLAMHSYNDVYGSFPPAYRAGKGGKALLSWRVLILPFIDQDALYKEFHLDEPWDSEHNKKLIARMPKVYRSPGSNAAPGMTNYLTVRGPNTAFPGSKGVRIRDIPDGLSNTIMVVEVSDQKAVIWTRPDDLEFNEKKPPVGLRGLWPWGFLAAFCDGSVRLIQTANPKVLSDLFNRNDGNVLPSDF